MLLILLSFSRSSFLCLRNPFHTVPRIQYTCAHYSFSCIWPCFFFVCVIDVPHSCRCTPPNSHMIIAHIHKFYSHSPIWIGLLSFSRHVLLDHCARICILRTLWFIAPPSFVALLYFNYNDNFRCFFRHFGLDNGVLWNTIARGELTNWILS